MRVRLLLLLLLLTAISVSAQDIGGMFGPTRMVQSLAAAPGCTATTIGGVYVNSVTTDFWFCNGTAFTQVAASSGTALGTGTFNVTGLAAAPSSALTTALVVTAGNIDFCAHSYQVTYTTAGGETTASATSNAVTNDVTHAQNSLSAVPVSTDQFVTQRKVYRNTCAAPTTYKLQQTIANNTATTGVQDNTADSGLGAAMPTTNTATYTSMSIYPDSGLTNMPGSTFIVTSDFTDASSAAFQNIPGLTWTLPANVAANYPFQCNIMYNQTVAAVSDSFGIKATGLNPTNISAESTVQTAAGVYASLNLPTLATQTATAIATFTPSAITTIWVAQLNGMIENPSGAANVINISVSQSTAADLMVVKRGSYCVVGH